MHAQIAVGHSLAQDRKVSNMDKESSTVKLLPCIKFVAPDPIPPILPLKSIQVSYVRCIFGAFNVILLFGPFILFRWESFALVAII
jgi:hypothetical protein